jgi:outer membrane lipoprotein-sorting protein
MISGMKACASAVLALILACAVAGAAAATAPLNAGELMQMLASVDRVTARFVETRTSTMLSTPLVLQGTLAYRRPDRIEKFVQTPYEERMVIEGGRLTLEKPGGSRTKALSISSAPGVAALVESIRATRAGDLAALQRYYALEIEGGRAQWTLTLRPLDPQLAGVVRSIAVAGNDARIVRVSVEEIAGDRSVMEISERAQ